tara:strand:- start:1470 stop:1694 length:225 start_codon:yes stop_codon:yes gene_type:complete
LGYATFGQGDSMKVGDLIKAVVTQNLDGESVVVEHGVVLQLSITGVDTLSAKVLFQDGQVSWLSTSAMEVISES